MPAILKFDDFELDADGLELRRGGTPIKVDALVIRLLSCLVRRAGVLITKEEIFAEVWEGRAVADNVLTVSMARLRKALGHRRGEREFVTTSYGRGYRFVREVVAANEPSLAAGVRAELAAQSPPFVGREHVMRRLRDALGRARDGHGRMCTLIGEPGIGKTRAVEALHAELADADVGIAWGFCRQGVDTPPLWPWLRLLREVYARCGSPEFDGELGPWAAEVQALIHEPLAGRSNRSAGDGDGTFPDATRLRSMEAVLRALQLGAARVPWILVLDDLHAADAASLELLARVIDELAQLSILLVSTIRPGQGGRAPRPDTPLPFVIGHRNCERIALERLREQDVAAYVAAVVDDPDGALGRAVFAKSEGNPFFMVELSRQLQDAATTGLEPLKIPDPALELLRQRIERLDADTRLDLTAAAVLGHSFDLPLLSAVTGRDASALMPSLDDALAAEVVVAAPDSVTAFAFGHELLRMVLYDALSPAEQRRWHACVARALERRLEAGEAVEPSELAYHHHAALPDIDARKAVDYCRAAAAASAAVFANTDVVRYLRNALEALALMERPSVRLRMGILLQIALYGRSQAAEFESAVRELARLAREHGDGVTLVHAACMLNPHLGFQPLPGAGKAAQHALTLLLPNDDGSRAVALAMLACASPASWSAVRSRALLEESVPHARRCKDPLALRTALACQLYVHGGAAQKDLAGVQAELEQIARRHPNRFPVLPVDLSLARAIGALQRGDVNAIATALDAASARCRELRHDELLWHSQRFQALSRINAGAWPDGVAALDGLHRQAERHQILGTSALCAFDRSVIFSELAAAPPLDDALRGALAFDSSEPPSIWALKLRALSTLGLADEARAVLRTISPSDLADLPKDRDYLGTLGHVARAALTLSELEYAEATASLLLPHRDRFAGHVSFLCEGSVAQLLGMLEHALGRRAQAISQLEAGIRMNDRAGFAPRAAEARLRLAEILIENGRAEEHRRALALARKAASMAARLGMQRLVRSATALVRTAGST